MIRSGTGTNLAYARLGLRFALLAVCALSPLSASAQPSAADRTQAEALFNEGKKLFKEGKTAEACRKFEGSYRIDPTGGTVLNLAACHDKEGKIASAWGEYKEALAAAKKANRKDREKLARDRIDALEPRLPYVVVIPDKSDTKGLAVGIDEDAVTPEAWGAQLPIDPGAHTAKATAPGYEAWEGPFEATEGKKITVRIPPLKAAPIPRATASAGATAAPLAPVPKYPWMRPSGIAIGTVGVAAIVAGAVFGARALDLGDKVKKECDAGGGCSDIGLAAVQDGRTSATASDVLLGAGAGFAALGAVFFIVGGATQPASSGAARLAPVAHVSQSGATFGLEGAW